MKSKFLVCLLGGSLLVTILLLAYLTNYKIICSRIHVDEIDRECTIIADEETAERIARAFLDSLEEPLGFEEGVEYDVEVIFDERRYEWIVSYSVKAREGYMVLDGGKKVGIRRDNGMIYYYGWR